MVAVILLVIAAFALLGPQLPFGWRNTLLPCMGVVFIIWAALARSPGLVIPGGILVGVGTGILLKDAYGPGAFLLSMAAGFGLVALLTRMLFPSRKGSWWPLWPMAGLTFAGLVQFAGSDFRRTLREIGPIWPYILIAVALYLLFPKPGAKARE